MQQYFDVTKLDIIQLSVACNLKFVYEENLSANTTAFTSDMDIVEVSFENPPQGASLMLTQSGVAQICNGGSSTVFRKCFSNGLCNFDTNSTPTAFRVLDRPNLICKGVHGYSSISTVLRRSSDTEPFVKHPVAMLLNERSNPKRYIDIYKKNFETMNGAVSNLEETGVSYRLEVTFESKMEDRTYWNTLNSEFHSSIQQFERLSIDLMETHGILYPSAVFPKALRTMCNGFKPTLDKFINKVEEKVHISVKQKETAVALENLMIYCINGNGKNLTHSYFTATRIRERISTLGFPFTKVDISPITLETDLHEEYYCGLKLLQQSMNPLDCDSDAILLVNHIKYRIEIFVDNQTYQNDIILKLLYRLFRRDLCNVFKKQLLKSNIDSVAKYRLFQLEPEVAFFVELEKEIVYNSVPPV